MKNKSKVFHQSIEEYRIRITKNGSFTGIYNTPTFLRFFIIGRRFLARKLRIISQRFLFLGVINNKLV
jgi:hypothetical protein